MRYRIILSLTVITVLTAISFSNTLDNGFTNWDDNFFVTENPVIKELSWNNTREILTTFYKDDYRPLTVMATHALEHHFFGLDPFIYHLDNLILHLLNTWLVFYLIWKLSRSVFIAFITAMLFGVHPIHVEAVAWISDRKGLLCAFFFLQTTVLYLLYKETGKRWKYHLSVWAFVLALLSKVVVVMLPFVLLLCDYLERREWNRKLFWEKTPFFLISAVFTLDMIWIYEDKYGFSSDLVPPFQGFLSGANNLVSYLTKTVLPLNLSAIYTQPGRISILMPEFFVPVVVLTILAIAVWYSTRYTRKVAFASLFTLVMLLPVVKLIPFMSGADMADRYMYLPSIGVFYLAALACHELYSGQWGFKGLARVSVVTGLSVIIVVFSVLTFERNKVWKDSETLWTDTVMKVPASRTAHNNLGSALAKKGDLERAISELEKALAIDPEHVASMNNLGITLAKGGRVREAVVWFRKALVISPDNTEARANLDKALGILEDGGGR